MEENQKTIKLTQEEATSILPQGVSEAAKLFVRWNEHAQKYKDRLVKKHTKGKTLSIIAHKLGTAVFFMLKNKEPFDQQKLLGY